MTIAAIDHPARKNPLSQIRWVFKKFSIDEMGINNHRVFTFSPAKISKNVHLIYFHGGAYVWQGEYIHWFFLRKLIRLLNFRISYIDYPLAPEYGWNDTFDMVQNAFENLAIVYPDSKFVFMGDSAGAGLALAFAQKLKMDDSVNQPEKIILLSPWLDMTLKNPGIQHLESKDPLLSVEALLRAADLYARGSDKSIYLFSPINGEIKGLGEIHVFIGTSDILMPDAHKFLEMAKSIDKDVHLYEYKNMPHIWMFFPFRESRDAISKIVDILMEIDE